MVTRWVVNASPIILLSKIGRIDLLRTLAATVVIPLAAVREVECRGPADPGSAALAQATWLVRVDPGVPSPQVAAFGLGDGESAVLSHALCDPGSGVILDDRAARNASAALGIPYQGTLGLIAFAKSKGLIPAAKPLLETLRLNGMYLSDQVMNRVLEQVGE